MKPTRSLNARRAKADAPPGSGIVAPPSAYAAAASANRKPAAAKTTVVRERRLGGQAVEEYEPPLGALAHRDGHRPVQLDHRRRRHLGEVVVEGGDRPPVGVRGGGGADVLARDRRLKAVHTDPSRTGG